MVFAGAFVEKAAFIMERLKGYDGGKVSYLKCQQTSLSSSNDDKTGNATSSLSFTSCDFHFESQIVVVENDHQCLFCMNEMKLGLTVDALS